MFAYHDAGFVTWDLADHYGPAEDFVGEFRRRMLQTRGESALADVQAFTKWVPQPGKITREVVEQTVGRSLKRMNVTTIDLLQFHWWDYDDLNYLAALSLLAELKSAGVIRHWRLPISTQRTCAASWQRVSPSSRTRCSTRSSIVVLTSRWRRSAGSTTSNCWLTAALLAVCSQSDTWGRNRRPPELNTASLQKYKHMIDLFGATGPCFNRSWSDSSRRSRNDTTQQSPTWPFVTSRPADGGGCIVGARLGVAEHRDEKRPHLRFHSQRGRPLADSEEVLAKGRNLSTLIGDCGDEYRL